jgi:hypothetical protein
MPMKSKTKKREKLGIAGNISAAASRLGLTEQMVKSAKDAGADGWKPNNSIDCDALMAWMAANPQFVDEQGERPDKELEEALWTKVRRQTAEIKRDQLNGLLVPKVEVKRSVGKMTLAVKQKLYSLVPAVCAGAVMKIGLSPEQAEGLASIIREHHVSILKEMNEGQWGEPKCPKCEEIL